MRQICPSCSQALDINDAMLGKLVRCPHCQLTFVSSVALAGAAAQKAAKPVDRGAVKSEGYELEGGADAEPQETGIQAPKYCPNCGKDWVRGKLVCGKCRYDLQLRRVVIPEARFRMPKVDVQSLYILLAVVGLGVGGYFLFKNWNTIFSSINSLWR